MMHFPETSIEQVADDRLQVKRSFNAPADRVWAAWTEPQLLDQWWAPRPWKAVTKSMDFRAGGSWLYYMLGPEGERQYCRADYKSVNPKSGYVGTDAFTDENGTPNGSMPSTTWNVSFAGNGDATDVTVEMTFASAEDLRRIVEMGFKEGFTMAHGNLDELLASQDSSR